MPQLSQRASLLLHALVSEFIATGEPVGSRTLQKKYGVAASPATIRSELADLEDDGYLAQPHTSAGRVPTLQAFRVFIDTLLRAQRPAGAHRARFEDWLTHLHPGSDILRESGRLLSDLTGSPAVAARPRSATRSLRKLRFIATRPGEILAVVVFADGTVENRYVTAEHTLDDAKLERVHRILEEEVEGRTLSALRDHFADRLAGGCDELAVLSRIGLSLVEGTLHDADRGMELVIEGVSRLLERGSLHGAEELRDLFEVLEDKARLVALLDETLASTHVQVYFDDERARGRSAVSLVAAPYREDGGATGGVVGIIGPARMDYSTVVPLVGAAAAAVSSTLARTRDGRAGTNDD